MHKEETGTAEKKKMPLSKASSASRDGAVAHIYRMTLLTNGRESPVSGVALFQWGASLEFNA